MIQPIAYLPCELKGRDLASRALIASHLVARGYPVVLGQEWAIYYNLQHTAPKGCVLFKTSNRVQAKSMAIAAGNEHFVFASDEECLSTAIHDYARTTDVTAAESCHAFLALNKWHADSLRAAYPQLAAKPVIVAGSPRVDLLRAADTIRPLAEDYILFNTTFAVINSVWGDTVRATTLWANGIAPELQASAATMIEEYLRYSPVALAETHELIEWAIANSGLRVVIRPHPQEKLDLWRNAYDGRALILDRSDPTTWIQHARISVHSDSTTGVEAAIMGAPVLNLSPLMPWRDRVVTPEVNVSAPTALLAAEIIDLFLKTGAYPAPAKVADEMFPADGAAKIADEMAKALPPPGFIHDMPWICGERAPLQREKFTVSIEEMRTLVSCDVTQADDSLFLLNPRR